MENSGESLTIAICDDEHAGRELAQSILQTYSRQEKLSFIIRAFETDTALFAAIREQAFQPDIIFMDIQLKEASGIEAVRTLNALLPEAQIVYMTNYIYFAMDVYETRHSYFIVKSEMEKRIPAVMKQLRNGQAIGEKPLIVPVDAHNNRLIRRDRIRYLERILRETRIRLPAEDVMTKLRLDELEELLPDDCFIRCHNSFIISFPYVKEYTRAQFTMQDGTVIPISRQYSAAVREAFAVWSRMVL